MDVQITGLRELGHGLGVLAVGLADGTAMKGATTVLSDATSSAAPVRTGALRDSVMPVVKPGGSLVKIDSPYASYVADGTRYMAAIPFVKRAVETSDGSVTAAVNASIEELIHKGKL